MSCQYPVCLVYMCWLIWYELVYVCIYVCTYARRPCLYVRTHAQIIHTDKQACQIHKYALTHSYSSFIKHDFFLLCPLRTHTNEQVLHTNKQLTCKQASKHVTYTNTHAYTYIHTSKQACHIHKYTCIHSLSPCHIASKSHTTSLTFTLLSKQTCYIHTYIHTVATS